MRFKNLFLFIALLLISGLSLSYYLVRETDKMTIRTVSPLDRRVASEESQDYLLNVWMADLEKLVVKRSLQSSLLFKSSVISSTHFTLADPLLQNVDEKKISDFVSRILTMKAEFFLDVETIDFTKYGFSTPYISILAYERSNTTNTNEENKVKHEILIGDRVPEKDNYRYVYSSHLKKVGVVSSILPLLEKNYSYFYRAQNILQVNEKVKKLRVFDFIKDVMLEFRLEGEQWNLYKSDKYYTYLILNTQDWNFEKVDIEKELSYTQKEFNLEVNQWILNYSFEDADVIYNNYEKSDFHKEDASYLFEIETDETLKNIYFYQLFFTENFFARLGTQNFIFNPKKETYDFPFSVIEKIWGNS